MKYLNEKKISREIKLLSHSFSYLSERPNLSLKDFPAITPTLDKYLKKDLENEWITPSQNLWGLRLILRNLPENERVDILRDGFAELIERLQNNTSVPSDFSIFLWLIAALEEDLTGRSPLTQKYSENLKISDVLDYILHLLLSACSQFLNRTARSKEQILDEMKEIVENSKTEQNIYLNSLKYSLTGNKENLNVKLDENFPNSTIDEDERILFEINAIILEFPFLLHQFLKWYYEGEKSEVNPSEIVQELTDMGKYLNECGYSSLSLFPFEFSNLIPKVVDRSIWKLEFGVQNEYVLNFFKEKGIFELWPPQIKAIQKIKDLQDSYFIIQPTGSGKSLIAHLWIYLQYMNNRSRQIIYLVPSKALAYQTTKDLNKAFGSFKIAISNLSGIQLHPILDMARRRLSNILVMTSEKFNFLYQNGEFERNFPSAVIIDEAHNIFGDNIRDFRNAISLLKLRLNLDLTRVLALSGVMDDPELIRKWESINIKYLKSIWRSTRLNIYVIDLQNNIAMPYFSSKEKGWNQKIDLPVIFKTFKTRKPHVANLLKHYLYQPEYQTAIVFCNSRRRAEDYAEEISNTIKKKIKNKKLLKKQTKLCEIVNETLGKDSKLITYIKNGVAFHHAGIPIELRDILLEALNEKVLHVISATTTLAEGLNTPADIVVIPYDYFYDTIFHKVDMSFTIIKNMIGRAGRAAHGGIGIAFIYTSDLESFEKREIKNKLHRVINFSESFRFQEDPYSKEINAADYNIPELLQFRPAIYSLICENLIDSSNPEKFIDKLDIDRKRIYKEDIIKTIISFKRLNQLLTEASPLKSTKRGWLAYQTGLDPFSFQNLLIYINTNLSRLKEILKKPFLKLNSKEREIVLKLLFVPDEARIPKNQFIEVKNRLNLLISWLNSNGSLLRTYKDFSQTFIHKPEEFIDDIFKISSTIYAGITNTIPWTAWGILQTLQQNYGIVIHPSYSLLPLYIRGGTLEPLRAVLNSFQVSPSVINEIVPIAPKDINNDSDISLLFNWIIHDLRKIIKNKYYDSDDIGLLELQLISLRFEKDNNKTLFLAVFYAGWYNLALNALDSLTIEKPEILNNLILECLDIMLRNYNEYKLIRNKKVTAEDYYHLFKQISEKKEISSFTITQFRIFLALLNKFNEKSKGIEYINSFLKNS